MLGQIQASYTKVVARPCPGLYIISIMLSNGIWRLLGLWRPSGALRAGPSEAGCLPDACLGTRLHTRPLRVPGVTHIDAKGLWAGSNAAPGSADGVNVELALKLLRQHAGAVQPALTASDPPVMIFIAWKRAWARQRTGLGPMRSGAPSRMAQALHTEHALAPFFDEYIISTI